MTVYSSVAVERLERRIEQLEAALAEANAKVKFCPYCGGAFVPEAGYEGPCAGCAKHLAAEAALAEMTAWRDEAEGLYRATAEHLRHSQAEVATTRQALAAAQEAVAFWNDEDEHSLDSAMLAVDEALTALAELEGQK